MPTIKNALAVVLALLLSASAFLTSFPIESAYAQLSPVKITGLGRNILEVHYQESTGILWALAGSRSAQGTYLLEINPVSNTLVATYNVTSSANSGVPWDLWCGQTSCFITTRSASGGAPSATAGAIIRVETVITKGTVSGTLNADTNNRGFGRLDGRDSTSTGIGGIALYVESFASTGNLQFIIVGGVGTLAISANLGSFAVAGGFDPVDDIQWSGIGGSTNNYLFIWYYTSATTSTMRIFNLSTLASICGPTVTITSNTHGGQIIQDITNRKVYGASGSNGDYSAINIDSCAVTNGAITDANTGLSGILTQKNGIAVPARELVMYQESGANARISTSSYNFNTGTPATFDGVVIEISPNNSQSARFGRAYYAIDHDADGQNGDAVTIGTGAGAYNGIFIPMNADQTILVFKFAPLSSGGDTGTPAVFPQNNIPQVTGLFMCLGGFINATQCDSSTGLPTNGNPKTNGTGIAVLIFLIIISYAFLVWIHIQAMQGAKRQNVHITEVMNIHPIILVLMLIADFSFVWYLGWLDDIIFYTMIVAVAGLGALGFYARLKGFGQ